MLICCFEQYHLGTKKSQKDNAEDTKKLEASKELSSFNSAESNDINDSSDSPKGSPKGKG